MTEQPDHDNALEEDTQPLDDEARYQAKRKRARRVLLGGLLFIALGFSIYGIWPWLLPAFIYEGPMLQLAGENEATLVWYMTRPVGNILSVTLDDGRTFAGRQRRSASPSAS